MTASSYCRIESLFLAKLNGGHHITDVGTPGNYPWSFVDHRVIESACVIIILIVRLYQSSSKVFGKRFYCRFIYHGILLYEFEASSPQMVFCVTEALEY
jgi:hypothetical protein